MIGNRRQKKDQAKIAVRAEASAEPFLRDEELAQAISSIEAGQHQPLADLIAQRPEPELARWAIQESKASTAVVRAWAQQDDTVVGHGQLGRILTRDAWEVRGSGRADQVPKTAWETFYQLLRDGETAFADALAIDAEHDDPWSGLLTTGRGLSASADELRYRFDQAHAARPFASDACSSMLQVLCAKWQGSDAEMFEFARWIEAESPPSAASRAALPQAHMEMIFDNDGWLERPEVVAELTAGLDRYLQATSPSPTPEHYAVLSRYMAALFPSDAKSATVAQEALQRLSGLGDENAWLYFGGLPAWIVRQDLWARKLPKLIKKG